MNWADAYQQVSAALAQARGALQAVKALGERWAREEDGATRSFGNAVLDALRETPVRQINVASRIAIIERTAAGGDTEKAHRLEKQLWQHVLEELAKSQPLAGAALQTINVRFPRHYA